MKIFKNALILNLLIILVIVGVGFLSYLSYLSYQKQGTSQKSADISGFLDNIIIVIDKLNNERINTATYLVSHDKNKYTQINNLRDSVDEALSKLNKYVKNNTDLNLYSKYIKDIYDALHNVRAEVDALNNNHIDILFNGYHNKVFRPFAHILRNLSFNQTSPDMKNSLLVYGKIITLKENMTLENTEIYSILLKETKMSDKDKIIWDQIVAKDQLPQFDILSNRVLVSNLNAILPSEKYEALFSNERKQISLDSINGKYRISIVRWLDIVMKKADYFTKIESLLHKHIKKLDEKNVSQTNSLYIIYIVTTLILLLLLFKLISIHSSQINNKNLYEDTLKDIELVFDQDQQKKVKRLIENGQVNLIYKFLIQAIEDANRTKDLFLASMSHEIRTPLNGILGFTQLLKETNMTKEQNEFLTVVQKSSNHLLNIVNDILDLSKIKAMKIELENIEFDPVISFESAIESYSAKAIEEDIDFNIFLDPQLPTLLLGDPTKISQIIVNLVSNAIKFTSKNGEVGVRIEKVSENSNETKIKFSISDTGIGISKEQQKKIFEAFSQADISTSRKYGGTGLGLSISGKLINSMDSELHIKSIKDEGSTFYFTLILKKPKGATRRAVEDMSSYTVGILNSHIDTEYYINENLEAYVAYTGANVKRYTDEMLLEIKNSSKLPDILFVDHKFRQRGGEIEKFLDIGTKIIVISTRDQKRDLQRYKSRIDNILYKPITLTKALKSLSNRDDSTENKKQIKFENIHILVAEDNLINQKLLINVLNRIGIDVSIANNGLEAFEHNKNDKYDMIFMDIEMPVMGGMEATVKILNYERDNAQEHTPIIALTANSLAGDKEKYISVGMDGYLAKPIELDRLRDIFKDYFGDRIVGTEHS